MPILHVGHALRAWGKILGGRAPMLSIEITRECPLSCPGCYAYEPNHLGSGTTLRDLSDLRGEELVRRTLAVIDRHRPMQVSIVGGEPLIRHRELSKILPAISRRGIYTLVVTSAIVPVPKDWNRIPMVRIAVSVDGLQPDHDERRKPATYERILSNIAGRQVDLSWVITSQMLRRSGYVDEYLRYWSARPEIQKVWPSLYTPQMGEKSEEMLNDKDRIQLVSLMPGLKKKYPKLLVNKGIAEAFQHTPAHPDACTYAKLSVNYSADLRTRVEPCFYGGEPDCSQCGCAVTAGLHWVSGMRLAGPLRAGHLLNSSIRIGSVVNRVTGKSAEGIRWKPLRQARARTDNLVQIH